ncbi:MAG TPA: NAD-dependent epimerase/dehydratase family protein [Chloroflexi bacterium]|nr:NAD-dependent epimerase/dehydratase family protein [Chloroflexota bacterium]
MKVLVTGGAGFIGSHVVDALIQEGHDVVVVDDLSSGKREHVDPAAKLYQLDIRDPQLREVFLLERPEQVNHHAAHVDVRGSVADPLFDAQVNILGSLNLLETAREHGVDSFIYASTGGAVYGEPSYLPCDEAHPVTPICPYAVSKLAVERYVAYYGHAYGLRFTILRYPNVYGPRQDPFGEAGVVAIFARQMLQGEQVVINGSGEQERDFVYVDDIVAANLLALDDPNGEIYNLGAGVETSINQLFAIMKRLSGYARDPIYGPTKPGETFKIYLDATKAGRQLRWRPRVSLEDGLRATIASFQ